MLYFSKEVQRRFDRYTYIYLDLSLRSGSSLVIRKLRYNISVQDIVVANASHISFMS